MSSSGIRAQRAVFSVCGRTGAGRAAALPPPLPVSDPALARLQADDRGYQIASMIFYRDPPGARPAFRAIAGSSSRHAAIARYMVAAIDARGLDDYVSGEDAAGGASGPRGAGPGRAGRSAGDPRRSAIRHVHPLAQGLIGYLGYWTGDAPVRAAQVRATLEALAMPDARIMADRSARDRYARAIHDIRFLRRSFPDEAWWQTGAVPTEATASRAMAAEARRNPFAAWLLVPASPFERGPWIEGRQSPSRRLGLAARSCRAPGGARAGQAWAALLATLSTRYAPDGWRRLSRLEREVRVRLRQRTRQERPEPHGVVARLRHERQREPRAGGGSYRGEIDVTKNAPEIGQLQWVRHRISRPARTELPENRTKARQGLAASSSSMRRVKVSNGTAPDRKRPLIKNPGVPFTPYRDPSSACA